MGGTDDPSNLIDVTREEHARIHKELYEKYGKLEDLGAYYLLNGQTDESMKICSSLGGRFQGKRNAESGHCKNIANQYWSDVKSGKIQRPKRIWIYNKETNHSLLILETDIIPNGYQKGRKII